MEKEIEKAEAFLHAQDIYQSEIPLFRVKELLAKYADQQTSELKAELFKATETAKITSVTQRQHIERLQNELNELKERHKRC